MPGNDLARQIKERLTTRQVVELYGFHPDRGGYIQCPFHMPPLRSLSAALLRSVIVKTAR